MTAELAGTYWLWGDAMEHAAITKTLLKLSEDRVAKVRFVATEKGLFNIPNRTETVVRRIIDLTLAEKEHLPEKLYPRIGAVLRRTGPTTEKILLEYLAGPDHSRQPVAQLYRDALRSDPPSPK